MKNGFILTLGWIISIVLLCTTWIILPELENLNIFLKAVTSIFSLSLVYFHRKDLKKLYQGEVFVFLIRSVLILSLLVLGNYWISFKPIIWDFSTQGQFSLSLTAKNIINKIDEKVEVKVFARPSQFKNIKVLMDLYKSKNSNWSVDYIDVDLRPELVRKYKIEKDSQIHIKYKNNSLLTNGINEKEITTALIKLTKESRTKIAYIIGHGEFELEKWGHLVEVLEEKLIDIVPVKIENLDNSYAAMMLWGPVNPIEIDDLKKIFLLKNKGIHLIIGMDPQNNQQSYINVNEFLMKEGLFWVNSIVIDHKNNISKSKGTVPVIESFSQYHDAVKNLKIQTFFPLAGAIKIIDSKTNKFILRVLAQTNTFPNSFAKVNWDDIINEKYMYNDEYDLSGPIPIVVSSKSKSTTGSELILFSNTTFMSDSFKNYQGNFMLFSHIVSFLTNPHLPVMDQSKPNISSKLMLSGIQINYIYILSSFILPICFIMIAWFWYYYRRNS